MPFFLIIIGSILIVTGFQNTYVQLGQQLSKDFTGQGNFFYWFAAILIIGAVGYIKPVEPVSRLLLALILIAVFVSNRTASIIQSIPGQIAQGTSQPISLSEGSVPVSTSTNSGGSSTINQITGLAQTGAEIASLF